MTRTIFVSCSDSTPAPIFDPALWLKEMRIGLGVAAGPPERVADHAQPRGC